MYTGKIRSIADWLGIAASSACAVHCVLIPALLVTGTILPPSMLGEEAFHRAMLWLVLPVAIVAFGIGCWWHRDRWVLVLSIVGLAGIVAAATVLHDVAHGSAERILTLVSAAILLAAHYRNFQLCRTTECVAH